MDGAALPAAPHSVCTRPLHSCTAQPRQLAVPAQIPDPACQTPAHAGSLTGGWAAQGMDRGRRGMRRGWNGPDDRLGSDEALSVEELVQLIQVRPWGSVCSAGKARWCCVLCRSVIRHRTMRCMRSEESRAVHGMPGSKHPPGGTACISGWHACWAHGCVMASTAQSYLTTCLRSPTPFTDKSPAN